MKFRAIVTVEYEPNPDDYGEARTPEEMANMDEQAYLLDLLNAIRGETNSSDIVSGRVEVVND